MYWVNPTVPYSTATATATTDYKDYDYDTMNMYDYDYDYTITVLQYYSDSAICQQVQVQVALRASCQSLASQVLQWQ